MFLKILLLLAENTERNLRNNHDFRIAEILKEVYPPNQGVN